MLALQGDDSNWTIIGISDRHFRELANGNYVHDMNTAARDALSALKPAPVARRCPDGGDCEHGCRVVGPCWRVTNAATSPEDHARWMAEGEAGAARGIAERAKANAEPDAEPSVMFANSGQSGAVVTDNGWLSTADTTLDEKELHTLREAYAGPEPLTFRIDRYRAVVTYRVRDLDVATISRHVGPPVVLYRDHAEPEREWVAVDGAGTVLATASTVTYLASILADVPVHVDVTITRRVKRP